MFTLAPWFYRKLLGENDIIELIESFEVNLLTGENVHESNVFLQKNRIPSWVSQSQLYKNCDGSGTSIYKNIAVYKAISEALERLAFYEMADTHEKEFSFDVNPTTTGMAAYPHFFTNFARNNAMIEAVERWAIHQFNFKKLPIKKHLSLIENLDHFEIVNPLNHSVSILAFKLKDIYAYGFAGGLDIKHSYEKALIELDRNIRVLKKKRERGMDNISLSSSNEKTLSFFSTIEGFQHFQEIVKMSPQIIQVKSPRILCDKELKGSWSSYTKVWRFLYEDSYFPCHEDESFFMFGVPQILGTLS